MPSDNANACRFCHHAVARHNNMEGCEYCSCLGTKGEARPRTGKEMDQPVLSWNNVKSGYNLARTHGSGLLYRDTTGHRCMNCADTWEDCTRGGEACCSRCRLTNTHDTKDNSMPNAQTLEDRKKVLQQRIDAAADELAQLNKLPEDKWQKGDIIRWTSRAISRDLAAASPRTYDYTAIKVDEDKWYLFGTQPSSVGRLTLDWDGLVTYMANNERTLVELKWVSAWEFVVRSEPSMSL